MTRIVAVLLAVAGVNARLGGLSLLAVLIVINLVVHAVGLQPPIALRVPQVAVIAAYISVAVATGLMFATRIRFRRLLMGAGVLAGLFVAFEAVAPRLSTPVMRNPRFLSGVYGESLDPSFGGVYRPYGELRTRYPSNPRGYFDAPGQGGTRPGSGFSVTAHYNALGCRGGDAAIPNPHTRRRVLVLGGAPAFGIGVRDEDTIAARLQATLAIGGRNDPEVLNCALAGAGTRGQLAFYEQVVHRYDPDTVLLVMDERDNLSALEETQGGYVQMPGRLDDWLLSMRLLGWRRHEGRRPYEYAGVEEAVSALHASALARRARFDVVLFRTAPSTRTWASLHQAATTALAGSGVSVLDLGDVLLKGHGAGDLRVHPLDPHPNEIAHAAAAAEIHRVLAPQILAGQQATDRSPARADALAHGAAQP